jgi:hypothetical protein
MLIACNIHEVETIKVKGVVPPSDYPSNKILSWAKVYQNIFCCNKGNP